MSVVLWLWPIAALRQILIGICLLVAHPVAAFCDRPAVVADRSTADAHEADDPGTKNEDAANDTESVEAKADCGDPDIADLLQRLIAKHKIPGGMVAAIVDEGQVRAIGSAGLRKKGSQQQLTVDDKMHLGSCTKAMTATMIATLVEEGLLQLGHDLVAGVSRNGDA